MDGRSKTDSNSKATLFVDDENEGKSVAVAAKDVVSKLVPTTPSSTTTQTQFELKSESEEEMEQGMKTLRSHTTDVEDHAAKVSVENQMQVTTISGDVEDHAAKASVEKQMQVTTISGDVEDHAAKVSVENQMQVTTINGVTDEDKKKKKKEKKKAREERKKEREEKEKAEEEKNEMAMVVYDGRVAGAHNIGAVIAAQPKKNKKKKIPELMPGDKWKALMLKSHKKEEASNTNRSSRTLK